MTFPTDYGAIIDRIKNIDPIRYGKTRNYIDGDVTFLSPYISRGVISTKEILEITFNRGFSPKEIEKFIQELVWREYWQEIWWSKGESIDEDLRHLQIDVLYKGMPKSVLAAETGVTGIDQGIESLYHSGYMHNHIRMYTASLICNIGKRQWYIPAKWMYFHLLDGDWASNALSWQWVAGSNSDKKYYANQENINRFCHTKQTDTFLDRSYEELAQMSCPDQFIADANLELKTELPPRNDIQIDSTIPTVLYTSYNLDPNWLQDVKANRVLILEPSHFEKYPVSQKVLDFIMALSQNISGIQVFVGEYKELVERYSPGEIYFKNHPFTRYFKGIGTDFDKIMPISGDFSSFFKYWNKGKKSVQW
jgi:deoxyribodipyrimidine photo-lyase